MKMLKWNNLYLMTAYSKGWLLVLWVAMLSGCQQAQQQPKTYSYVIVADVEGCTDCTALLSSDDYTTFRRIDSTRNNNNHFVLKGKITRPGLYSLIYFSKTDNTVGTALNVYLPADSIHITVKKNSIRTKFAHKDFAESYLSNTVIYSAAPQQREWEQYLSLQDSLVYRFLIAKDRKREQLMQAMGTGNKVLIEQRADSARSFDYRAGDYYAAAADLFVRQHPASEIALYAMLENRHNRPAVERFRRYYEAMPPSLKQSFYGQILDKKLAKTEGRNQNSQRFVGHRIQQLAGKTPAGKELNAEQLFKQNKLTLIEFWASWCGPCRMEMPKYYKLYKQYQGRGFGMVGVSLDADYNKWVKAIKEDSLQIPHLSELQGDQGADAKRFGIVGIPANLLVDSTGRVVAVDIPFPKLYKKLQQAL
jgi:thiol-disulfide isomerase/thioredoxin